MNDEDRTEDPASEEPSDASEEPSDASEEPSDASEEPSDATKPTEQLPPAAEHPTDEDARPRRLLRSRDDRMIAGVAGGLANYFNVDPVIFRIGFAVSVFFGGLGVLAYIALALFVPSAGEAGEESPAPVQRSGWLGIAAGTALIVIAISSIGSFVFWGDGWWDDGWHFGWIFFPLLIGIGLYVAFRDRERGRPMGVGRAVALAVLIAGSLIGLTAIALVSAYAGATGGGVVIGALVIAIGALLVGAAFRGGARWLVVPALALAVPLSVVAATDVSFGSGVGEREHSPDVVADIPDNGYELGIGRLEVDLRDLDWRKNTAVDLDVDLGIGEAVVAVPKDVCVVADVHAAAGELRLLGDDTDGVDVDSDPVTATTATPRLDLTGEVDLGAFQVINDDEIDLDETDHRFGRDFVDEPSDSAQRAALDAACAPPPPPS
jgi:phage shock protein PspC (stress-responsive transcriptional regulator)